MTGRVVVTGSAGLLGRRIVGRFAADGWTVVGVDVAPPRGAEPGVAERRTVDLSSAEDIAQLFEGADAAVHAAAVPDLGRGVPEAEVLARNVAAASSALFGAAAAGVRRIVYVSSQSVLGLSRGPDLVRPVRLPIDEDHPCRPRDGYALSKKAGEEIAALIAERHGIAVASLRLPVVWDPDGFAAHVTKRQGDPAQAARSNWAYVDARDAAAGILLALTRAPPGHRVFNIAAARAFCDGPLERHVVAHYGPVPCAMDLDGNPALFSPDRARRELGFVPRYEWTPSNIRDTHRESAP
jgi:nucleoside-diphosphate-sugar epimerase